MLWLHLWLERHNYYNFHFPIQKRMKRKTDFSWTTENEKNRKLEFPYYLLFVCRFSLSLPLSLLAPIYTHRNDKYGVTRYLMVKHEWYNNRKLNFISTTNTTCDTMFVESTIVGTLYARRAVCYFFFGLWTGAIRVNPITLCKNRKKSNCQLFRFLSTLSLTSAWTRAASAWHKRTLHAQLHNCTWSLETNFPLSVDMNKNGDQRNDGV